MSYILDALKKAERERGIAKVPTLATVHEVRTRPWFRLWHFWSALILFFAAATMAFLVFSRQSAERPAELPAVESNHISNRVGSEQITDSASVFNLRTSAVPEGLTASPSREPDGGIPVRMQRIREASATDPSAEAGIDEDGISEQLSLNPVPPIIQSEPESTIPSPGDYVPEPGVTEPEILLRSLADQLQEETPPDDAPSSSTVLLKEAVSRMNMSILFYSENREKRLVFINGRKYVEGDTVEDHFLLETITPEGAVLRHNGEQIILRPEPQ
jgi:general secretion pathway protein B